MTGKLIAAELKRKGFKLTSQRRAIIEVISHSHEHFTPADIYGKVKARHRNIGLVTVYRALEMLQQNGMLCEVHIGDTCRSYLKRVGGHHHHLVCNGCGRVVDFGNCGLDSLEQRVMRETGFKIDQHLLEFSGSCPECQAEKRDPHAQDMGHKKEKP